MRPTIITALIVTVAGAIGGYWLWGNVGRVWVSLGDNRGAFAWEGLAQLAPFVLAAAVALAAPMVWALVPLLRRAASAEEARARAYMASIERDRAQILSEADDQYYKRIAAAESAVQAKIHEATRQAAADQQRPAG